MGTHVQSTGVQSSGTVTSQAKAFTSSVTAGNLIACGVGLYRDTGSPGGVSTVADAIGNSLARILVDTLSSATKGAIELWYKASIAGGSSTITVTPNASSYTSFGISEFSGLETLDTSTSGEATSTNPASGSITTVAGRAGVVVGVMTQLDSTLTITPVSPWNQGFEAESATNQPVSFIYQAPTTASTGYNAQWTMNSARWVAGIAAFKDPASGQDTPELYGRPSGLRGHQQLSQLLAQ